MPTADRAAPYLDRIDNARWYSNFGALVQEFEARLAARLNAGARVVTVSSGTTALTLALRAMGCAPGSLCAIPSWTFVATAHAVMQAGLVPYFLDVDAATGMLDPAQARAALKQAPGAISAVIPVCAFGRMTSVDAWLAFREETGIPVVLDAAAAFDAFSDARLPAVVSLHATKALGVGEGGYVATDDESLAARVRELTSFGFRGSRESHVPATNAKLSEYAAAFGLAGLDIWASTRARYSLAAQLLRIALTRAPDVAFQEGWGSRWISSTCVVGLPERATDRVEQSLNAEGVDTRRWWGGGCHTSPAFAVAPRGDLTNTMRLARSTIGLPFALDLSVADTTRIADALIRALA